jgi:penicillin-binding protein 2
MVVMKEQIGVDTLDLCNTLGITPEWYKRRMDEIRDPRRNPGYSRYTQQLFMSQLSAEEFSTFREKLFCYPGFYIQKRSIRQYTYPYAAHVLGDVGEVGPKDIERDDYYRSGDYIGKLGIERQYEEQLRGERELKSSFAIPADVSRDVIRMASSTNLPFLARISPCPSMWNCRLSESVL